jgi:hypothetical protein
MGRVDVVGKVVPVRIAPRERVVHREAALEKRNREMQRRACGNDADRLAALCQRVFDDDCETASRARDDGTRLLLRKLGAPRGVADERLDERTKCFVGRDLELGREDGVGRSNHRRARPSRSCRSALGPNRSAANQSEHMLKRYLALAVLAGSVVTAAPAVADDPGRIDAYVTPYYDSTGPTIRIGKYSTGLATKNSGTFVSTVLAMKRQWERLNFVELYVAAIRLYDAGYRNEATYWFYTAQFRGRQFATLVDRDKMGGVGAPAFELYHAQDAFFQLVGPNVNGYAFGDVDGLLTIVRKVEDENRTVPNLQTTYPGVSFIHRAKWQQQNAGIEAGLAELANSLNAQRASIAQQRAQNGTAARFGHLTSKRFPGGF